MLSRQQSAQRTKGGAPRVSLFNAATHKCFQTSRQSEACQVQIFLINTECIRPQFRTASRTKDAFLIYTDEVELIGDIILLEGSRYANEHFIRLGRFVYTGKEEAKVNIEMCSCCHLGQVLHVHDSNSLLCTRQL